MSAEPAGCFAKIRIPSPEWGLATKNPPNREDLDERGEIRTLNQRLKRPMLCH